MELSVVLLHEWLDCGYLFMACVSHRCSSLFLVTVERKYHPEEAESEVCRSRLQLFSLTGGADRTDLRGSVIQQPIHYMGQRH